MTAHLLAELDQAGFAILPGAFPADRVREIISELNLALSRQSDAEGSIRSSRDLVYAARNLISMWPGTLDVARAPALRSAVQTILGPDYGLVRAIFFDKPPGRSWSLPWHKDMTIAVRDNRLESEGFSKPTTKAGVPHVEAPQWLLQQMLTARIHLDDVTAENGPLLVVPGSHHSGKDLTRHGPGEPEIRSILVSARDVLLVRPLVAHSSGNSREGTLRHRRIVHLEFASVSSLPGGYHWHDFRRPTEDATR